MPVLSQRASTRDAPARAALMGALVLLLTGCDRDRIDAPETRHGARSSIGLLTDPDVTYWNAFDADVNITFSGNRTLASMAGAQSGVGYHVHKRLGSDSAWLSDFNYGPYTPRVASSPGNMDPPPIVSAIGAGACRAPAMYDSTGTPVSIPTAHIDPIPIVSTGVFAPAPVTTRPTTPAAPLCGFTGGRSFRSSLHRPRAASTDSSRGRGTNRDWIMRYIVTAANAKRMRARLVAEMGPPTHERGHSRFAQQTLDRLIEVLVNDSTGAIDELHLHERGTSATIARSYARQVNGLLVLQLEHITAADADSTLVAMDVSYRNVRISRED